MDDAFLDDFRSSKKYRPKRLAYQNTNTEEGPNDDIVNTKRGLHYNNRKIDDDNMSELTLPVVTEYMDGRPNTTPLNPKGCSHFVLLYYSSIMLFLPVSPYTRSTISI